MWVADMDFRSPEPVVQALEARVRHGVFGYPVEIPQLREVIVDRMWQLYDWEVEPEEIIYMPGVIKGFNLACQAVAGPRSAVLVQPPIYPPILEAPDHAGMARQEALLALAEDGNYQVDWETFEGAIDERTRLYILCNPHNPTGRVFRRDELARLAEICLREDMVICSDEIHCELVYPGQRHIPIATLDPEVAQNTITLMAPSKTFNLPGLQCSYAIIQNPDLRERYRKVRVPFMNWVNILGQVAALAAYQEGDEWHTQLMAYLEGNRNYVHRYVIEELPGISMARPEGTYLAWLDCRESGIPGDGIQSDAGIRNDAQEFFLKQARVALNKGTDFGAGGEGFVRLNFGCPRAVLDEGLSRMKSALQEIGAA
jgi:cystathionine beta-lyase